MEVKKIKGEIIIMKKLEWSVKEDLIIKKYYDTLNVNKIQKNYLPNRTSKAISNRANELGLSRHLQYTDEEKKVINRLYKDLKEYNTGFPKDEERMLSRLMEENKLLFEDRRNLSYLTSVIIRSLRDMTGLSQSDFGEKYHINVKTLNSWEQGIREVPSYYLYLLEDCMKLEGYDIETEKIAEGSNKKVWWTCDKGHKWQAVTNDKGCPYCSNKKIKVGYNDLATTHPKLLEEWNYEKNEINPTKVMDRSYKKVWWKCSEGHSWVTRIVDRTQGQGCPYCSGKKILAGYNDLATTNSELLEEWDYEKNEIKPTEVVAGSHKKVWWRCKKGHSWQSFIYNRTRGFGCPYCSGHKK